MSRWFPRADNEGGLNKALLIGSAAALIVVAMDVYGIIARVLRFQQFSANGIREPESALLIVGIGFALVALIAAWRFATGKGLVWGSVVLLLVVMPLVGYLVRGPTSANIGWLIIRFPLAAALVVGVRGAWAARNATPRADYAEVFD